MQAEPQRTPDEDNEDFDETAPPERTRLRDAERSRARILDAAERIFARQGFEAARLQEIGRVAGVSRGTPGYFFRSKEQLYRTVMERLLDEARAAFHRVESEVRVGGGEPWHLLEKYIEGYLDFLAARPAFVRLVQWECVTGGPFVAQVANHFEALRDALARVLEAGGARFRPVDPMQLMLTIIGAAWLPFTQDDTALPLLRVDADNPVFLENRKRHLAELVLHGVARPVGVGGRGAIGGRAPGSSLSGSGGHAGAGGAHGGYGGHGGPSATETHPAPPPAPSWRVPGG